MPEARKELIITFVGLLFIIIIWESWIVFPVKLFVVLLHEISHVLTTYITGGKVMGLYFDFNLSGLTSTKGGNTFIIASSGYLGSLFWGSLLYLSSYSLRFRKWLLNSLSIVILLVTVNLVSGGLQILLGLLASLFFIVAPRYFPEKVSSYFLRFLGLASCIYVIFDIKEDLLTSTLRETDTQILEYITGMPSMLIGFSWLMLTILCIFFLVKFTLRKAKS